MSTHGLITVRCSERLDRSHLIRCAFCHGPLESEEAESTTCPACRTQLHKECIDDWGRCPTLGCSRRFGWKARPRHRIFVGPDQPSRWRRRWRLIFGVLLPLAAFLASEMGISRFLLAKWDDGSARSWLRLAYAPEVQRPLYPLLIWAVVSYLAALGGSRSRWVSTGLVGGALLSAAFSILFAPALPLSLVTSLIGIGFLGLSPYLALVVYSCAYARLRRARRDANEETVPPENLKSPQAAWLILAIAGGGFAAEQLMTLHAALRNAGSW